MSYERFVEFVKAVGSMCACLQGSVIVIPPGNFIVEICLSQVYSIRWSVFDKKHDKPKVLDTLKHMIKDYPMLAHTDYKGMLDLVEAAE